MPEKIGKKKSKKLLTILNKDVKIKHVADEKDNLKKLAKND